MGRAKTRGCLIAVGAAISLIVASIPVAARGRSTPPIRVSIPSVVSTGRVLSDTTLLVGVRGSLTITFHGDTATGCAARGLCKYSGTVTWVPRGPGGFDLFTYRERRHVRHDVFFLLGLGIGGPDIHATVARAGGGTCRDSATSLIAGSATVRPRGKVAIGLVNPGSTTFATHCAGPLLSDVGAALPVREVPLSRIARGALSVNMAGTASFASHGFAGTVTSSIVLRFRRAALSTRQPAVHSKRHPNNSVRFVSVIYRVRELSGGVSASVLAKVDPATCARFDACGLSGELTFVPPRRSFELSVAALGPARRPMRDFLAALGIGRGDPRGIVVLGGNNAGGGATVSEQVSQAGAECRDSAASGWTFGVYGGDGSIRVAYTPAVGAVSPARTRCPGPLSERTNQRPWVAGTFPATRFGHRSFAITLRASRAAGDAAYLVEPAGSVRLDLKRVVVLRSTLPGSGNGRGSNGTFTGTFFGG